MNLIALHGTVAAVLICCLLFVDEAGIPLPFAPNEALLLLTGVLIAGGAFPLWTIAPAAYISMVLGMYAGYSWARAAGQKGLSTLAEHVNAAEVYHRAQQRLRSASPWEIALARMVPGLRPYATLVSGAARVDIATFSFGALPALLIWEIILVAAGMLVGLPLAHLLSRVEKVVLRGAVLIVLAVVIWLATRHAPVEERAGIERLALRVRALLALAVDAAIVLAASGGIFVIGSRVTPLRASTFTELAAAAALLAVLLVLARRITTPGEVLFDTHYWHLSPAQT